MSEIDRESQDDLAGYFVAAKRESQGVPAKLMNRMLADAGQVQDEAIAVLSDRPATQGLFQGLRDMLGGWPAMAGLMTACATGIWLGFSPPAALPDPFEIAGLLQDDLDMFDADGLTAGWIETTASSEGPIAE